jgi:hypothetical protein
MAGSGLFGQSADRDGFADAGMYREISGLDALEVPG